MKHLSILVSAALSFACAKVRVTNSSAVTTLDGRWEKPCHKDEASETLNRYMTTAYVFTDQEFEFNSSIYTKDGCQDSDKLRTIVAKGSYVLGSDSLIVPEARELDLSTQSYKVTYHREEDAQRAGIQIGEEKDLTHLLMGANRKRFTVLKLSAKHAIFGKGLLPEDGMHKEHRDKGLESVAAIRRQ